MTKRRLGKFLVVCSMVMLTAAILIPIASYFVGGSMWQVRGIAPALFVFIASMSLLHPPDSATPRITNKKIVLGIGLGLALAAVISAIAMWVALR